MPMKPWQEKIRDSYGYEISNSLIRSKARTRSIVYVGYHSGSAILEISTGIGLSYSNTYGAIIGDGKRYSKGHSLTGMNLMLCNLAGNSYGCELTDLGKGIFEILKSEPSLA